MKSEPQRGSAGSVVRQLNQHCRLSLTTGWSAVITKSYCRSIDPALPRCGSDFRTLPVVMRIVVWLRLCCAALQRLAHATYQRSRSPASLLQAPYSVAAIRSINSRSDLIQQLRLQFIWKRIATMKASQYFVFQFIFRFRDTIECYSVIANGQLLYAIY